MVSAAAPASSIRRANAGCTVPCTPARILTETGSGVAATIAATIAAAWSGWSSSDEPQSLLITFCAGQPMLISIPSKPRSAATRAASAIRAGALPISWQMIGLSSGA